jgi:hypothetical protein
VVGLFFPGDTLVAVDHIMVENLRCSQITSLIAARATNERTLTVQTRGVGRRENSISTIGGVDNGGASDDNGTHTTTTDDLSTSPATNRTAGRDSKSTTSNLP